MIKGIRLRSSNAGLRDGLGSCLLKNEKLDLWVRPWSLTPSRNLGLEPFGWCDSEPLKKSKSSRSQIIFEISSIKNFTIFTGEHLFWGLLIMLQAFRPATFSKSDPNTGVSCGYCEIFKNAFHRKSPEAVSDSHSAVKSARVFLIWFRAFTCFQTWLRTYAKGCTNNSLLSSEKIISFLLEFFYQGYLISEYVL